MFGPGHMCLYRWFDNIWYRQAKKQTLLHQDEKLTSFGTPKCAWVSFTNNVDRCSGLNPVISTGKGSTSLFLGLQRNLGQIFHRAQPSGQSYDCRQGAWAPPISLSSSRVQHAYIFQVTSRVNIAQKCHYMIAPPLEMLVGAISTPCIIVVASILRLLLRNRIRPSDSGYAANIVFSDLWIIIILLATQYQRIYWFDLAW